MTIAALALLTLVLVPLLSGLLRHPGQRRIVVGRLTRRPGETLLVAGGTLLATGLITGSMVAGDSFDHSLSARVVDELGWVDETVDLTGLGTPARTDLDAVVAGVVAADEVFDRAAVVATSTVAIGGEAHVVATIEVAAEAEGAEMTGVPEPAPGVAVIRSDLADDLELAVGDRVTVSSRAGPTDLVVGSIEPGGGASSLAPLVVSLETFAALDAEIEGRHLLASNLGDERAGADRSIEAVAALEQHVAATLGDGLIVRPVKRQWLDLAADEGAEMTSLFGTIGGFGVAAGVLLIVNLFVLVAEGRRSEQGTLRAVGYGRGRVARLLMAEGAVHGAVGAIGGTALGAGIGAGIVAGSNALLVEPGEPRLSVSVEPATLAAGAAIGLAISLLTVVAAATWAARGEIVAALADREPSPRPTAAWRHRIVGGVALALAGGALSMWTDAAEVLLLAPIAGLLGASPWLALAVGRGDVGRARAALVTTAAALAWAIAVFEVGGDPMDDVEVTFFLLQGLVSIALAVRVLVALDPLWHRLGRTGAGLGLRLGVLEPLEHRMRTSLLIAMSALVVFTVTMVAVIGEVFAASSGQLGEQAGGRFDTAIDVPADSLSSGELVALDSIDAAVAIDVARVGRPDADPIRVSFVDLAALGADGAGPELDVHDERYPDAAAMWADPGLAGDGRPGIVAGDDSDHVVGDVVVFDGLDGPIETTVVAVARHLWLSESGLLLPVELAASLVPGGFAPDRFWLDTIDPSGAGAAPAELLAEAAVDVPDLRWATAATFAELADDETAGTKSFLAVLNGYLAVGLLVGISGLSVVLLRAVQERRRNLAVLRAVGVRTEVIRRAFLVEGVVIGAQGVATGMVIGLLTSWLSMTRSGAFEEGLTFAVPWTQLGALAAVTVAASLAASVAPSLRAGRIPPAAALRV